MSSWISVVSVPVMHLSAASPAIKSLDPLTSKEVVLRSKGVRIGVSGFDLRTRLKKAFGGALEKRIHKIGSNIHPYQAYESAIQGFLAGACRRLTENLIVACRAATAGLCIKLVDRMIDLHTQQSRRTSIAAPWSMAWPVRNTNRTESNPRSGSVHYSNLGRYSRCTRRRMDLACPGVLSMKPLRSRVLIISWIAGGETWK